MTTHHSEAGRQDWRTPRYLFEVLQAEVGGFGIDLAASAENALCENFLSEDVDALTVPWVSKNPGFLNPPFKKILPWLLKAESEVEKMNVPFIVMLVPVAAGSAWFDRALAKHRVEFFDKRLRFEHPSETANSPPNGHCLVWIGSGFTPTEQARRSRDTGELLLR